jgi:hypothetical protein
MIEMTRIFSDTPGTPGLKLHMPIAAADQVDLHSCLARTIKLIDDRRDLLGYSLSL